MVYNPEGFLLVFGATDGLILILVSGICLLSDFFLHLAIFDVLLSVVYIDALINRHNIMPIKTKQATGSHWENIKERHYILNIRLSMTG